MKQHLWIIEFTFRIYVWSKIWAYGIGKIVGGQFHRAGRLPEEVAKTPIADIGSFDLAWTFFGFSTGYIWFIGLSQILGGGLLLFNRTKIIGVFILIPILLNIIVVDFFFEISPGAMLSAIFYLLMCCYILYYNKKQLIEAVKKILETVKISRTKKIKWIGYCIAIVAVVVITIIEVSLINWVGR
ncbi:hypothetical protein [Dokdonia sp.]|uniref:hypothetical protein n=1 Tax=Dokdonia sp. TaxID=2024995 RepID=UPI003264D1D2